MATVPAEIPRQSLGRVDGWLLRVGYTMQRHRRAILAIQWSVVVSYLFLIIVPALLPLPGADARLYRDLTLFAQFLFCGIWSPFFILHIFFRAQS